MIELWRSEEMQLVQLIIPTDAAHETIAELGDLGLLQFKDLNPDESAFSRTYASQVKRCNEMCRRLRVFHEQVTKAEIPLSTAVGDIGMDLDELEAKLEDLEKELIVINENSDRLYKSEAELVELQLVLEKAGTFFDEARIDARGSTSMDAAAISGLDAPLLADDPMEAAKATRLGFMAGTIDIENLNAFERLLFRATRGNMFLRHAEVGTVTDPNTNKDKQKAVFVVFFAGERARLKITKTCEAFAANRYPFPEDAGRQRQMHADVTARLRELASTMEAGRRHRTAVLGNLASSLNAWITVVRREKAVYHTLNQLSFDVTRQALVAEAWAPVDARLAIQQALQRATETSNAAVGTIFQPLATHEQPPTFYRTNKFTASFQSIVEAYGVARYRELNPATWTIITFPFLFAVMFGDVGHAAIMLVFGLLLLAMERAMAKQQLSDMVGMIFGGRYVIVLMAAFSVYTGFMYNEFFSMPMALLGHTKYVCNEDIDNPDTTVPDENWRVCAGKHESTAFVQGLKLSDDGPYPFGLDPIWHGTRTELGFLNSLKMKMSILMGVVHMTLGIVMSLFNHLHFRDPLSLYYEFIPQMIFLWSLFGYLGFLIIFKWVGWPYLEARSKSMSSSDPPVGRSPDLYHIIMYMFLSPTDIDCGGECTENNVFDGQQLLQVVLVLLALVAVPWMLLPKPLILKKRHERRTVQEGYLTVGADSHADELEHGGGGGHGHGEFEFGEVLVHQMIHTIEFVLGAVSNTASYLRLWALSLAHSQLSAVFYDKVLMMTINMGSPVFMLIGSFMWMMATLAVLMVMESLSAFLHALRLHWVEFQNKFYHGDGYAFAPFAFSQIDKDDSFLHGQL